MSGPAKLLVLGGVALAIFGMLYGLHYALFVEHQTLDGMGASLTDAFVAVSQRNGAEAEHAIATYGDAKYKYVRQVDAHSHWIGLAMLMIVLGAVLDRTALDGRLRHWLALSLLAGSVVFPLGVVLQTVRGGGMLASGLAVVGSGLVTVALAVTAAGFVRER